MDAEAERDDGDPGSLDSAEGEARIPREMRMSVEELEGKEKMPCPRPASMPGAFAAGDALEESSGDGLDGGQTACNSQSLAKPSQIDDATGDSANEEGQEIEAEPVSIAVAEPILPQTNVVQVMFDEEATPHQNRSINEPVPSHNATRKTRGFRSGYGKLLLWLLVFLIVLCISAALVQRFRSTDVNVEHPHAPTLAPTFSYECFTSTEDIFQAQIDNPEQDLFVICPNTELKIGYLANPAQNDTSIVNGQKPLILIRENVEIRCGLDGSVDNNCVFVGGFLHVLLSPLLPNSGDQGVVSFPSTPTHNALVRGLTFTGQIVSDYVVGGGSLAISNPGRNMQFVDCLWENISTPSGLIHVGTIDFHIKSGMGYLGAQTVDFHLVNCTFRNIFYDGPLLHVWEQNLTVSGCRFENVRLSPFLSQYCPLQWCQSLISCTDGSVCHLHNVCIQDFEYAGSASIVTATNDSRIHLSGFHYTEGISVHSKVASDVLLCESRLAQVDYNGGETRCMDEGDGSMDVDWIPSSTCLL